MLPPKLLRVQALPDYRLQLHFANGESGTLNMTPYLEFGIFTRLRDRAVFEQAKVSFDAVEWPGGIDLDTDFLYQKSKPAP